MEALFAFVSREQQDALDARIREWEFIRSQSGIGPNTVRPPGFNEALTLGSPSASPHLVDANAGFLLPIGAGAWAVQGGVRGFQIANFMRAGYSFNGARALHAVGTELRTGGILS
ncbi:hypothetical protein, partial [Haloferula sp. A504]|uniref:hypothetical protein n=1 Tax=Haloferula sp. A504 TaxID=3373601 RepID=UPI0031CA0156|nr:hypothetical protein [Verrucomicrobiaceae bacterium E54]